MTMPTWEQFAAPVVRVMLDGVQRPLREIRALAADDAQLDHAQRAELLPSGQHKFENRIGWAVSYLNRVGALERPVRGQYRVTDRGRALLAENPDGITELHIRALASEGDVWWKTGSRASTNAVDVPAAAETALDPVEQIEEGIARINDEVAADLLSRLQGKEWSFFEHAVVDLLVAMGFGGTDSQVTVTQSTNDGGIDGIIDQDALGLDRVYVQAKRYATSNAVQRPELQAFVGALSGKAERGVFFTTSRFTPGAREYAANIPTRIILIDGERLTRLMIKYGVGVQVESTYRVVKVDEDFFE